MLQTAKRKALIYLAWLGFLDIICTLLISIIAVTVWRIPYLLKAMQVNGHLRSHKFIFVSYSKLDSIKLLVAANKVYMSMHNVIILAFTKLCVDLPVIFVRMLLYFLCPWRLYISSDRIVSEDRIPQEYSLKRALSKLLLNKQKIRDTLMPVAYIMLDYLTLLECAVLFVSLVKAHYILTKISQLLVCNKSECEIYEWELDIAFALIYLLADILVCVLGISCLCLLLHAKSVLSRIINLKHNKHGNIYTAMPQKTGAKVRSQLLLMPDTTFHSIMAYLHIIDIANLSQTSVAAYKRTANSAIWKNQYYTTYHKYSVINENNIKNMCINAYTLKKIGKATMSDWDIMIGWRAIILEGFIFSIIDIPHIILLPVKLLGYACTYIEAQLLPFYNGVLLSCLFYMSFMVRNISYLGNKYDDESANANFWSMHNVFIARAASIYCMLVNLVSYWYEFLIYHFCYALCHQTLCPIAKDPVNMVNQHIKSESISKAEYSLYLQAVTFPIYLLLLTVPFLIMPALYYSNVMPMRLKSIKLILLIVAFEYSCAVNILLTSICLLSYFPTYKPINGKRLISAQDCYA